MATEVIELGLLYMTILPFNTAEIGSLNVFTVFFFFMYLYPL